MAKFKPGQEKEKINVSFWDGFKGLRTDDGWTITYSPKTGRASLRHGDEFKVADVSLESLKRAAAIIGVKEDSWKKMG